MERLGKYLIRRPLGKGAMGIVYEGFDPVIERTVAIKTILPSQLAGDQAAAIMARFKREAQAAGRLNHPGIVAIYEYGEDTAERFDASEATAMAPAAGAAPAQRVAFIAMEFVKGRELKDVLDSGERFALPEVGRVMAEVLDAVAHAHANGVVHRDLKPANLIMLDSGRIKVADFGIARVEDSALTQAGAVMGTPSYMSPEQFMGQPVDGRSDLFSCGVILYQLLTGEKPFTGETTTTVMYKVLREEPVPPSALNLSLTPALDAVMRRALAKQPAQRFQTAGEFAAALQSALAGDLDAATVLRLPQGAASAQAPSPTGATASVPLIITAPTDTAPGATSPAQPSPPVASAPAAPRRSTAVWAVVGIGAVAALAGGYLLWSTTGRPAAPAQASAGPAAAPAPVAPGPAVPAAVAPPVVAAAPAPAPEPGTLVISALATVDPKDARFQGDASQAQAQARDDARRRLIEKALAAYVEPASLDAHRALLERRLMAQPAGFIRTVLTEDHAAQGTLVSSQTRAVVNMRELQKSLNQLSREERVEFIRRGGDPRIAIQIDIGQQGGGALPKERSQLAENVLKERIKSFGFRVWSSAADGAAGPQAQQADFAIRGEVKLKQLSARLEASGITITKTALTSWTIKAIDTASGEEVYLNTRLPSGRSWASEDAALAEIGKLVGDEFSRNFFLSHAAFRAQRASLRLEGLPEGAVASMLRELRSLRTVLDAQSQGGGRFTLELPEGDLGALLQEQLVKPLNARLGSACLALAGVAGGEARITVQPACATPDLAAKLDAAPPPVAPARPAKTSA